MPSSIRSFSEFDKRLLDGMQAMDGLCAKYPGDQELLSIKKQLEAAFAMTRGGRRPTQDEKDSLNFGLLASRFLADIDENTAQNLYEIASYITYS